MISENERELRRLLEEPPSCECRNYPLSGERALVTLIDTPYYPPYAFDALHVHNCLEIGFCMAGSGKIRFRGVFYRLTWAPSPSCPRAHITARRTRACR